MKAAAIVSGLLALIANSEIVTLFLLLCWTLAFFARLYDAHERRND